MPNLSTDLVLYEKGADGVARITINRPDAMNALSREVHRGLREAWLDVRDDPAVRVAVITGAGGHAFCAGDDLAEVAAEDPDDPQRASRSQFLPDMGLWKPVIAAIDGYCLGGGLELALQCDIRVATEQSQLGLPEPKWGIMPSYSLQNLISITGRTAALYLLLTGNRVPAAEAYRTGLLHSVHPDRDTMMAAAEKIAADIAAAAPLAVQAIKETAYLVPQMSAEDARNFVNAQTRRVRETEDAKEGPRAFAERRPPQWKGR